MIGAIVLSILFLGLLLTCFWMWVNEPNQPPAPPEPAEELQGRIRAAQGMIRAVIGRKE
jgi:hypothetical protein